MWSPACFSSSYPTPICNCVNNFDVNCDCTAGVVAAMDQNPKAVAQYLESTLVATYSNVQKASQSLQSRSSLLDVSLIPFPIKEDGKR